jgi:hypothetical protein
MSMVFLETYHIPDCFHINSVINANRLENQWFTKGGYLLLHFKVKKSDILFYFLVIFNGDKQLIFHENI